MFNMQIFKRRIGSKSATYVSPVLIPNYSTENHSRLEPQLKTFASYSASNKRQLNKMPESIVPTQGDIELFRDWLKKQPHLPNETDSFIRAFLVKSRGSLRKAKATYEAFFHVAGMLLPYFRNGDPLSEEFEKLNRSFVMCPSENKLDDGTMITYCHLLDSNAEHFRLEELLVRVSFLLYTSLWENTYGNGKMIMFMDFKHSTVKHASDLNPVMAKHFAYSCLGALPVRLVAVHFLNMPPVLEWVTNIFRPFLPEKVTNIWYTHRNSEDILNILPRKLVPQNYGGDANSTLIQNRVYRERLSRLRKNYMNLSKLFNSNQYMRNCSKKIIDTHDSFRKLQID